MPVIAPSYIPEELKAIWIDAYVDAGGAEGGSAAMSYALEVMRGIRPPPESSTLNQSQIRQLYDVHFGGNRREDGSLRFDELGYTQERLAFSDAAASYGIDPTVWEGRFADLIGGDVDSGEFAQRLQIGYEQIIEQAPEIAAYYADNFGAQGLEPEDVLVAFLDPDVGEEVLARNASVSLVGGSAAQYGFQVAADFAESLLNQGVRGTDAAQDLFGQANEQLPILEVLAQRHNDPDDDFDINEFSAAYVFNDPFQRRRISRLIAQERSLFSGGAVGVARDRSGSLTGLTAQ